MLTTRSTQTTVVALSAASVQTRPPPVTTTTTLSASPTGVAEALLRPVSKEMESVLALVGDDPVVDYTTQEDDEAHVSLLSVVGAEEGVSEDARQTTTTLQADDNSLVSPGNESVPFGSTHISLPRMNASPVLIDRPHNHQHNRSHHHRSVDGSRDEQQHSPSRVVVMIPSNVDAEEAARTVERLRNDLDELRIATTLREKELHSIVESCRSAIKGEYDREWSIKEIGHKAQVDGLERALQQLKDVVQKRDETIRDKQALLTRQDEIVNEAKRERDRHWMVVEGQLRSDVGRHLKEKEKMRFDVEVASSRLSNVVLAVQNVESRAEVAERTWQHDALRKMLESESAARDALEAHALEVVEVGMSMARQVQRLDDYHTIRAEERWLRVYQMLEAGLQYDGEDGLQRLLEAAPRRPSTDPLLDQDLTTTAAEVQIHELILERATNWRQLQHAQQSDAQARDELLIVLQAGLETYVEQTRLTESQVETQLQAMAGRCQTSENVLALCSSKISGDATTRAKAKATGGVLDDLVREHDLEMESLHQELRQTRLSLEEAKRINMAEEAMNLQRKVTALEAEKISLQRTATLAQAQVKSIEAASQEMRQGATESMTLLHMRNDELEALRRLVASRDIAHRDEVQHLKSRVSELETETRRAVGNMQSVKDDYAMLTRRNDVLLQQNNSLKDKFVADKTEELVARVNHRLATEGPIVAGGAGRRVSSNAEDDRLQQKVLMLRRENDALAHRLDSALAEASHAEEQRQRAMERSLAMMSLEDAAPKREQALLAQQAELDARAKQLHSKEQVLIQRLIDLERREAQLGRMNVAAGGENRVTVSSKGGSNIPSGRQMSAESSARSSTTRLTSATGPVRLAPIALRPAQQSTPSDRSDHNPQKYVPSTL